VPGERPILHQVHQMMIPRTASGVTTVHAPSNVCST